MHSLITAVSLALVPQPQEVSVADGTVACPEETIVRAVSSFEKDAALPEEGYRLSVSKDGVRIAAADEAGAFYAGQTLRQLADGSGTVPCVKISDAPKFPWRGVLLDDSRHFFGKDAVKRTIDLMASFKMNVLHWHLTDDQGWRVQIDAYPELTRTGATRPAPDYSVWIRDLKPGTYGPFFYTKADIREIVAYAAERHVTIVPEIELPGHVAAALAAYPEFACRPENLAHRHPRLGWGIAKDVLCLGNDKAVKFMEDVLDYVCRIFPGPYVHIGGDECPRVRWKDCPKCQKRIADEGLRDAEALQPWITRHFVKFLEARGKRAVGWDEYLNGEVPTSAIGMSWRTPGQGTGDMPILSSADAAARGHDMVTVTHNFTYFCYGQGLKDDPFYGRNWGKITLEKAYSFDPCLGVPANLRGRILGGQCCNWSEQTLSPQELQWKMWPRTCAIAEVLWLGDKKPGFADFRSRMKIHRDRLIAQFVNCATVE